MDYFITQCQAVFQAQGGLFLSLFLGGLLGSISHCTGMCGPIVMAQTSQQAGAHTSGEVGMARMVKGALLPYHLGRMSTYMLLGIVGASMSQLLIGTPIQKNVAALMLLTAGMLFLFKAVPQLTPKPLGGFAASAMRPYGQFIGALAAPFARRHLKPHQNGNLFFFGVMLGFLPCGLVMAAVMAVASTGDPLAATFGMISFSIGTMPALLVVGASTSYFRRKYPREVDRFAKTIMGLNGLILCGVAVRLAL